MAGPPKTAAILEAARALFLRHGMRKVRVEEICADARVSKRTFYKYFRNKDDIAGRVLAELFEVARGRVEEALVRDCPIEEKVRQLIALKTQLAAETSAVFYREAIDGRTPASRVVLQEQRRWDERVKRFYRAAQTRGEIRADIDVDLLMLLLVRIRELFRDPELARLAPDFSHLVETVMKLLFYGLVPRAEHPAPSRGRRKPR